MPKKTIQTPKTATPLTTTGIAGLDHILNGGLTPNRLYLVEGAPGSGKTTLALQFLLEGARLGEPVLYLTLSETTEELHAIAASHGWSLDGVNICEMTPSEDDLRTDRQNTIFHPSEVELGQATNTVLKEVERVKPKRVAFDSLSEMRLLAGNPLRYRRQLLALKQFFTGRRCTVVLLDDRTAVDHDPQIQSIAHGVILLEQLHPEFGAERRRLKVVKYRGMRYRGGHHDFVIRRGGIEVFPRRIAAESRHSASGEVRQAMSIVKKRAGAHERTIREFRLSHEGIWIGEPLRGFRGVLTGVPVQESETSPPSHQPST